MNNKKEILIEDKERIKEIMKALGLNSYGLSKALGYKNHGSIYNIGKVINGREVKIGKTLIEKLIAKYPQVSLKYAKYGEGEVLLTGKDLIAQANIIGIESGSFLSFEEEVREKLREINEKLDILLERKG